MEYDSVWKKLMVSDIPERKYDDYFVYGVGMIDVEFSKDEYMEPEGMDFVLKDIDIKPAIEIVIQKEPREIERKEEGCLRFRDLKLYLQIVDFSRRNEMNTIQGKYGEAIVYTDDMYH